MKNVKYDNYICKLFRFRHEYITMNKLKSKLDKYPNIVNYLTNRFNDCLPEHILEESVKRILFIYSGKVTKEQIEQLECKPICHKEGCNNHVFFRYRLSQIYTNFCCWKCAASCPETDKKKKQNSLENWGTEFPYNSPKFQEEYFNKHGYYHPNQDPNRIQHRKDTLLERKGTLNMFETEVGEQMRAKLKAFANDPEIAQKRIDGLKRNYTYNSSRIEEKAYILFKSKYGEIIRQEKLPEGNYMWDFAIPNTNIKIEIQGSQYHNKRPFDPTNPEHIKEAENLNCDTTQSIYKQWVINDPAKRDIANRYNQKIIEIWNEKELHDFFLNEINSGKIIYYTDKKLQYEYEVYNNLNGAYNLPISKNYLIQFFQQTSNISDNFNPFTFKKLCEDYNLKRCYDPCGKLGYKMLGSSTLDLYIYNEQDNETFDNTLTMGKYLKIIKNKNSHITIYNNDPQKFIPKEDFDSIILDTDDESLINKMLDLYNSKDDCKFLGISTTKNISDYTDKIISNNKQIYIYTK